MNDSTVVVSCVNAFLASLTFGCSHTLHPKHSMLQGKIRDVEDLINLERP